MIRIWADVKDSIAYQKSLDLPCEYKKMRTKQ